MNNSPLIDLVMKVRLRQCLSPRLGGLASVLGPDLSRFPRWGLYPRSLVEETLDCQPEELKLNTPYNKDQKYNDILHKVGLFTLNSFGDNTVPYHGLDHNLDVGDKKRLIDDKFEEITGYKFSLVERQISQIAGIAHDCFHNGELKRRGERGKIHRPELGKEVSVESVSALELNDFLARETQYPILARWLAIALVNSTYGPAKVGNFHTAGIRLSDVAPTGDFIKEIDSRIKLDFGHINPALEIINDAPRSTNIKDIPIKMIRFYKMVKNRMDLLDAVTEEFVKQLDFPQTKKRKVLETLEKDSFTTLLGMREKLRQQITDARALNGGSGYHLGVLKTKLASHGLEVDSHGGVHNAIVK